MNRSMILIASALFALAACDDKKAETKTEEPAAKNTTTNANAPVATQVAATAAVQPLTIDDADLATPADFEEAAETSITKANYKAQLTTLEADIAKE
jgi:hypothetical protein